MNHYNNHLVESVIVGEKRKRFPSPKECPKEIDLGLTPDFYPEKIIKNYHLQVGDKVKYYTHAQNADSIDGEFHFIVKNIDGKKELIQDDAFSIE
jgi:hypothetical protein